MTKTQLIYCITSGQKGYDLMSPPFLIRLRILLRPLLEHMTSTTLEAYDSRDHNSRLRNPNNGCPASRNPGRPKITNMTLQDGREKICLFKNKNKIFARIE